MLNLIKENFLEAQKVLDSFINNPENFNRILSTGEEMASAIQNGNKIISCGNGGSMSDAMHFAEELTGRFRGERPSYAAIAISDPTHITCTANDYGFDYIFSRYVEGVGTEGDILLAISTSGNSANIYNAALAAKKKGMKIVALTGKTGGKLADIADIEIRSPESRFSDRIQEIHIKVIHTLIDFIETKLKK